MKKILFLAAIGILGMGHMNCAQVESVWSYDLGISVIKSSLKHQPDELPYNPVFEKWESVNRQAEEYTVTEYNALGIGGTGNITYTNRSSGLEVSESKDMAYSSHQINYFIGPLLPVGAKGAEIFMGFSFPDLQWNFTFRYEIK